MESRDVQQALMDTLKLYCPNIEELSEQDREIEILKMIANSVFQFLNLF